LELGRSDPNLNYDESGRKVPQIRRIPKRSVRDRDHLPRTRFLILHFSDILALFPIGPLSPAFAWERTNPMARNQLLYLTANDWILITAKAKRLTFRLGEEIIREGSVGDTLYVVRRGSASVELTGTGSPTVVAELEVEDICGDMAFIEKSTATASVIAKEDRVEVDAIQASALSQIFDAFPGVAYRFYRSLAVVLARRLKETTMQLAREKTSAKLKGP
jgi:CRP/FNR family transcriptional regulator, cyclic AMP receptor protein